MRKIMLTATLMLFLAALAACNNETYEYEPYTYEPEITETDVGVAPSRTLPEHDEPYENNEPELSDAAAAALARMDAALGMSDQLHAQAARRIPPEDLTLEHFLADLNHLVYVLENNFALFDVAYWARGVDIYALAQEAREVLLAAESPNLATFSTAITDAFGPLFGIAHFILFPPPGLARMADHYAPGTESRLARMAYLLEDENFLQSVIEDVAMLAGREMAIDFVTAIMEYNAEEVDRLEAILDEMMPGAASSQIIESGRIAHMHIRGFPGPIHGYWSGEEYIADFFQEIRGFEHLIIDLRNNMGGDPSFFYNLIVGPILDEAITAEGFVFLQYGEYASLHAHSISTNIRDQLVRTDHGLMSIDYMLDTFQLPELNMVDMERMKYGFRVSTTVRPVRTPQLGPEPVFDGKIWLLINERSGSGAQIAAWFTKETDFATLVGEISGGNFGGSRVFTRLPYTAMRYEFDVFYVTDSQGRPLEAGTIPHYFNHPGMDALETVLAMINE